MNHSRYLENQQTDRNAGKKSVGLSAHWSDLRRHGQPDALASKARDYILEMLKQDTQVSGR